MPSPLRERFFLPRCCAGSSPPALGAHVHGRHLLPAARGIRRASTIDTVIIWRRCGRRAQRAALPPQGEVLRTALLHEEFYSLCPWRPSSWVPSPRCRAGSSPGVHHLLRQLLRHNLAPRRPPGSADGPPPSGRGSSYRPAARGVLPSRPWRPSSWSPSARCHTVSSPGVRHLLCHDFASSFVLDSMALLCLARHNLPILMSWREQTRHVFPHLYPQNAA